MKKILSVLVFSLLSSVVVVTPVQAGGQYWQDGDYERICLTLGWSDCAVWQILDKDGVEKNRVIGPGAVQDLIQTCGENFCGGGESATAVKLETLSRWITTSTPAAEPSAAPTPAPTISTQSRIPYTQPCLGGSDRTMGLPQCLMPEGIGGSVWNLVDDSSGVVVNGAVCSEAVCGRNGEWRQWPADRRLNDRLWPNGYPEGATYIQTPFDSGYWGRYFTNGVYEVSGGGIVQPGSNTIIWPVRVETPRIDTVTVTSETSTSSVVIESSTTTVAITPTATIPNVPIVSDTSTATSGPSVGGSKTTAATTSIPFEATTAIAPVAIPSADVELSTLDEIFPEEEIIDSINAVIQSSGTTRIDVSTGYSATLLRVVATKEGVKKKYTYRFTTNSDGDRIFRTALNLRGYTLVLFNGVTELDRVFVS